MREAPTVVVLGDLGASHLTAVAALDGDVRLLAARDAQECSAVIQSADVVLCDLERGLELAPSFAQATRLRWIHSIAAGVEHMLFPALVDSDVPLTNGRGAYRRSLGEFVILGCLYFAKDVRRLQRQQTDQRWETFDMEELAGKTLGVVGYGEIGQASARLARAFGMRVLALRRHAATAEAVDGEIAWPPDRLPDLLAASDYVVVATPLTPETRGLIGRDELALMKPTAVVINVGRGPVIDEAALVDALRAGRLRGAVLDVFEQEPLPAGHPLYALENVLVSPHTADHVPGWLEAGVDVFLDNLERFRAGTPLRNVVDKRAGY